MYVDEHPIIDLNEQTTKNEIDNREIEDSKPLQIPANCTLGSTQLGCKILKIDGEQQNNPTFHFQINEKLYIYRIQGIRSDNKIIFQCTKEYEVNKLRSICGNLSYISATESLQKIIKNMRERSEITSYLGFWDSSVYDMKNYDWNSFEIGIGRVRTWEDL